MAALVTAAVATQDPVVELGPELLQEA